mgnify:CR=1 FL=1
MNFKEIFVPKDIQDVEVLENVLVMRSRGKLLEMDLKFF